MTCSAPHTFDEVRRWLAAGEGRQLFAAHGCEYCGGLGYAARTGLFEVMPITRGLRDLISEGRTTSDIRSRAVEEDMLEFRQAGLVKVALGQTTIEEILRVIPSEHLSIDN